MRFDPDPAATAIFGLLIVLGLLCLMASQTG